MRKPKPTDNPTDTAGKPGGGLVVERRKSDTWEGVIYQLAYNQRGDKRTGPYWRAYWHDAQRGRTRSKYIGKTFRELTAGDF